MAEHQQPGVRVEPIWRKWTGADYVHRGLWAVHLACGHTENFDFGESGSIPDDRLFRCSACEVKAGRLFTRFPASATYRHPNAATTGERELARHSGQGVTILRDRTDDPDIDGPEVGGSVIYRVRFADGFESDAFEDELTPVGEPLEAEPEADPYREHNRLEAYREAARRKYEQEGAVEIDADARVNAGGGDGAYVAAWVWVNAEEVGSVESSLGGDPGSVLPACGACGSRAGWIITSAAPVYVTVEPDGSVGRVRVNDEALMLEFEAGELRPGVRRSMVTCAACDVEPPQRVAAAVRAAAEAAESWPSWEWLS